MVKVVVSAEVDLGDIIHQAGGEFSFLCEIDDDTIIKYVDDKTPFKCVDTSDLEQKIDLLDQYMTSNELFEYMVHRLGVDDLMDRLEQEIAQED